MHGRSREYLGHAAELTPQEERLRDDYAEWLLSHIIDVHAHASLAAHVGRLDPWIVGRPLSTFLEFTIDDSRCLLARFFPRTSVRSVRFAHAFRGIDHRANNDYLLRESPEEDAVALYGLPDDVPYTVAMLAHPRVRGLKMYYLYSDPPATTIYGHFRPEILEEAQARDVPIILHTPRPAAHHLDELLRATSDFPRLRVVLAHVGLHTQATPEFTEAFARLGERPNVFADTSMNPSSEVVGAAIRLLGSERVMYGSDEPISYLRAVQYDHPGLGNRLMADYPYHWIDPIHRSEHGHLALGAPHAHWTNLGVIRKAIEGRGDEETLKDRIFRTNAQAVFGL